MRVTDAPWNRGYGAALKTGDSGDAGPAIMIMDADCSYPPEAIPRLYARLDGAAWWSARGGCSVRRRRVDSRPGKWVLNTFASYLDRATTFRT